MKTFFFLKVNVLYNSDNECLGYWYFDGDTYFVELGSDFLQQRL